MKTVCKMCNDIKQCAQAPGGDYWCAEHYLKRPSIDIWEIEQKAKDKENEKV